MKLKAYYFFISQIDEFYYKTINDLIAIPPIRTLQRFKSKIIREFGLHDHFLDGSIESVEFMINLYSHEKMENNTGIIAIDAASIFVFNDGTVKGLMNSYKMDSDFAQIMKESISLFSNFVDSNKDEKFLSYFLEL